MQFDHLRADFARFGHRPRILHEENGTEVAPRLPQDGISLDDYLSQKGSEGFELVKVNRVKGPGGSERLEVFMKRQRSGSSFAGGPADPPGPAPGEDDPDGTAPPHGVVKFA